jgi:hypothetical protein
MFSLDKTTEEGNYMKSPNQTILAIAIALTATLATAYGQASNARPFETLAADAHGLIGTWKVTVSPDGTPSFTAYNVFTFDGNSFEFDNSNPPAAQTIAVGPWTSRGPNHYVFTEINQLFDDKGNYAGELKVRGAIELTGGGDTYKSTFSFDVFDPAGAVVFSGKGTATAKRVGVEGQ